MILYLDSSALVKLCKAEEGSEEAHRLWEATTRAVTSRLAYAECRAALASGQRSGRLSADELRLAQKRLDRAIDLIDEVDLDKILSRAAGEIAEVARLRGGDAVHLATAIGISPGVTFATWDRDLARAADAAGLQVVPASR